MFAVRGRVAFDGERFLPDGATVLVEAGRIVGVEPATYAVPSDCELHDHGDATLLPGLIDTHVHLITDSGFEALDRVAGYSADDLDAVVTEALRLQLDSGVTTVRDLGDRDFHVVGRRDAQRAKDDRLPWIVASGPPITTPGGHCCYLGGEVDGPAQLRAAVRERVERDVDVVKVMASGGVNTATSDMFAPQFSLEELRLLTDLTHAAGLPVAAHAHAAAAIALAVQAGVDTIEHGSFLRRPDGPTYTGLLGLLHGSVSDGELAALAVSGVMVCPTLGGLDSALLRHAPPQLLQTFTDAGVTPEQVIEVRVTIVRRLAEAGVRLVNGMDAGIAPPKAHGVYHRAVEDLAAAIGDEAALAASTSLAAEVCGLAERKGRLRASYDADLLVVGGDLRSSLRALRDVRQVVLRGTALTPAS